MTSQDMKLVILVLQISSIAFSSTSFRRTTVNGTTTCGLLKPDLKLNFTTMSANRLMPSPPNCLPPEARCAFNCIQMNNCSSYNYKADTNQCEIYFNRTMPCAYMKSCLHLEVTSYQSCQAPVFSVDNWIIIQQRLDNTLNFTQNWVKYKTGFGTPGTNYWMGLESVYQITNNGRWKLRMEMLFDADNTWRYSEYASFFIDSEMKKYALHVNGYYGTAGDCLNSTSTNWIHNGAKFSTYDNQNDNSPNKDCANRYQSGWWFDNCYWVGLNLPYNTYFQCYLQQYADWMLLKASQMKIQPV